MSTLIELFTERGEIRVGDETFGCDARADGSLNVGGTTVRAITLAERQHLVSSTGDPVSGRAERLARRVGDAALTPADLRGASHGRVGDAAEIRPALDAIALYLAGATMEGSLLQTLMLATRSMGASSALAMQARMADEVAASLADALRGPESSTVGAPPSADLDGWTTIRYDPAATDDATGSISDIAGGPRDAAAVRSLLAARLLARVESPLDTQVVELIVQSVDLAGRAASHSVSSRSPILGDLVANEAARQRGVDRWGAEIFEVGEPDWSRTRTAVPDAIGFAGAVDGPLARVAAAQSPVARDHDGVGSKSGHRTALPLSAAAHAGQAALLGRSTSAAVGQHLASVAPHLTPPSESSPSSAADLGATHRTNLPNAGPAALPNVVLRQRTARSDTASTGSVLPSVRDGGGAAMSGAVSPGASAVAERSGLDDAAAALHRAADLRGVPR